MRYYIQNNDLIMLGFIKSGHFFFLAVLKTIVDFLTLLTFAAGTKTPVEVRGRGDPAGALAKRRLPVPPEPLVPGAEINSQV